MYLTIALCRVIFNLFSYLGLHTAYYNEEGVLITNPLMCAKHYVKSNFVYEFLANVLPTDIFALVGNGMHLFDMSDVCIL